MDKVDIPNTITYFLRQEFWARNTRDVDIGPFLVLFFGRIYKAAEMQILCCLHDNCGFIQLRKAGGIGNQG